MKRKYVQHFLLCTLLWLLGATSYAATIYVDGSLTTGSNNGSSWANAYTDLQSALASATSGDDIWVAQGTYVPITGIDQTITFNLPIGVDIYGGFDNGDNNGSIDLSVSGGGVYTYLWSPNNATTQDLSGIPAGTYDATITDPANYGCLAQHTVTVDEPTALATIIFGLPTNCNGPSSGSASVFSTGGLAPYSYLWSNGPLTYDNQGLSVGTYTVTVTDANGCAITQSTYVGPPVPPQIQLLYQSDVTCFGANDGSISVDGVYGSGQYPYSFLWSNSQPTSTISNLTPGNYSVTMTDANGCIATASYTINNQGAIGRAIYGNIAGNGTQAMHFVNCIFESNAGQKGGAIYLEKSEIKFINSYICSNSASGQGGGIYIDEGSSTTIGNCSFMVTIAMPLAGLSSKKVVAP